MLFPIIVVVFLVLFAVFWLLFKKPVRAFFLASLVMLIAVVVFGLIIYKDTVEFAEKFPDEPKLFLFEENDQIVAGAALREFEVKQEADLDFFSPTKLEELTRQYQNHNYKEMLDDYYLLLVIREEAIEGIEAEAPPLPPAAGSRNQTRYQNLMRFMKLGKLTRQQGGSAMLAGYRNKSILIYPEKMPFKVIKHLPDSLWSKISQRVGQVQ